MYPSIKNGTITGLFADWEDNLFPKGGKSQCKKYPCLKWYLEFKWEFRLIDTFATNFERLF